MQISKVIVPSLQAYPCSKDNDDCTSEVIEEANVSILLRAHKSGPTKTLYFQILSLPKNGTLYENTYDNLGKKKLSVGDILQQTDYYPYKKGVYVEYEGEKDFFTSPFENETQDDYFDFSALISLEGDMIGMGSSFPARQVRNKHKKGYTFSQYS